MSGLLDILKTYQGYGALAFAVSVFSTPIAVRVALRLGVMDMPDRRLKPHARPTPYLGGLAILAGWSAALLLAVGWAAADWRLLVPILLGGVAMSVIGLIDDIRDVPGKIRLMLTATATLAVLLWTGVGFRLVDCVLAPLHVKLPAEVSVPLSLAGSVFIVLGACNSMNLIDGLDGLC